MSRILFNSFIATAVAAGLVACGGSNDPAPATTGATPVNSTTINGSAVKGPVSTAKVIAKKIDGGLCGETITAENGSYSLTTACTGDVVIEVSGGNYTDEATNVLKALDTPLKVMVSANGLTVTGIATPLTTMAFSSAFGGTPATTAAFNAQAQKVAEQFGLRNINLSTTLPTVTGTVNSYGEVLKAISQYMKDNSGKTLSTITNAEFAKSSVDFLQFNTSINQALKDSGSTISLTYSETGVSVGNTGTGGGTGTCGVRASGNIVASGFNVPIDINYCVEGIAGGSCESGNSTLSQALSGQSNVAGAVNLKYDYSKTCAPGALKITLQ